MQGGLGRPGRPEPERRLLGLHCPSWPLGAPCGQTPCERLGVYGLGNLSGSGSSPHCFAAQGQQGQKVALTQGWAWARGSGPGRGPQPWEVQVEGGIAQLGCGPVSGHAEDSCRGAAEKAGELNMARSKVSGRPSLLCHVDSVRTAGGVRSAPVPRSHQNAFRKSGG